jgi:hypothetical protein
MYFTPSRFARSATGWLVLFLLLRAALGCSRAEALDIVFTVDPAYTMSPAALAGFETAAGLWEARLFDPVTVSITIAAYDFGPEMSNIIGGANPTFYDAPYAQFREAYEADITSDADSAVAATLSSGTNYQRFVNNVYPGWSFSLDSSRFITSHDTVRLAGANAKAIGLSLVPQGAVDATIDFNSAIGFDYDRSDGIAAGTMDFVSVAAHEIGHALGFTSIVNDVDSGQNFMTVLPSMPMDFIRYSFQSETWAVQDVSIERSLATQRRYLKIGDSNIPMSTGLRNGDGYQASHFLEGYGLGLMDPTIAFGETLSITANDLLVLDAVGWNIVAVPEPASIALAVIGIAFAHRAMPRTRGKHRRR